MTRMEVEEIIDNTATTQPIALIVVAKTASGEIRLITSHRSELNELAAILSKQVEYMNEVIKRG